MTSFAQNGLLLDVQHVTMRFGGITAVNDLSMRIPTGSITGLIGPNGAGKTTVFNLITGNYVPDGGDIRFAGQSIKGMKPHTIVSLGIARTFQSIRLFPTLPLVENVLAGRHCRMHSGIIGSMFHTPAQRREERAALERAMNELEFVGLADSYAEEAGSLSYGNQRLLEIARALASDPKLIILDEPAGSTVSATWSAGSRSWRPSPLLRCSSTPRETAGRTTFWKPCGARRKPTPTPTSG